MLLKQKLLPFPKNLIAIKDPGDLIEMNATTIEITLERLEAVSLRAWHIPGAEATTIGFGHTEQMAQRVGISLFWVEVENDLDVLYVSQVFSKGAICFF